MKTEIIAEKLVRATHQPWLEIETDHSNEWWYGVLIRNQKCMQKCSFVVFIDVEKKSFAELYAMRFKLYYSPHWAVILQANEWWIGVSVLCAWLYPCVNFTWMSFETLFWFDHLNISTGTKWMWDEEIFVFLWVHPSNLCKKHWIFCLASPSQWYIRQKLNIPRDIQADIVACWIQNAEKRYFLSFTVFPNTIWLIDLIWVHPS